MMWSPLWEISFSLLGPSFTYMAQPDSYPLILLRLSEVVEFVHESKFRSLVTKHLPTMAWLSHTILTYLQQYFSACTPAATKPKHLRALIQGDPIPAALFRDAEAL